MTTETPVFRIGDHEKYYDFLINKLWGQPYMQSVWEETSRLVSIFESAARVLKITQNDFSQEISPLDLQKAFMEMANYYGATILNRPLILEENFIYEYAAGKGYRYNPDQEIAFEQHIFTRQDRNRISVSFSEPSGAPAKNQRVFNTARFGFLSVGYYGLGSERTLVTPYIMLPASFLDVVEEYECPNILTRFADLSAIINHDWFHSILISSINPHISNASIYMPAYHHFSPPRIYNAAPPYARACLPPPPESSYFGADSFHRLYPDLGTKEEIWYEHWAMRFHCEVLQDMASQPKNPIETQALAFLEEWKQLASKTKECAPMDDPALTPAAYGIKLLAFSLLRAVPLDHPLIQRILSDPDVEPYRKIFENMYNKKMANVLFGNGQYEAANDNITPTGPTPEQYKQVVVDASANALNIVLEECDFIRRQEERRLRHGHSLLDLLSILTHTEP